MFHLSYLNTGVWQCIMTSSKMSKDTGSCAELWEDRDAGKQQLHWSTWPYMIIIFIRTFSPTFQSQDLGRNLNSKLEQVIVRIVICSAGIFLWNNSDSAQRMLSSLWRLWGRPGDRVCRPGCIGSVLRECEGVGEWLSAAETSRNNKMAAGGAWRRPRMKVYDYNQEFGGNYYQVWPGVWW